MRKYHNLDGLYGDVEHARREYEAQDRARRHAEWSPGALAYERWLEVLDIAEWHLEGADDGDEDNLAVPGQGDSQGDGADHHAADDGHHGDVDVPSQLDMPLEGDVQGQPLSRHAVGVAGATSGLTEPGQCLGVDRQEVRDATPTRKRRT